MLAAAMGDGALWSPEEEEELLLLVVAMSNTKKNEKKKNGVGTRDKYQLINMTKILTATVLHCIIPVSFRGHIAYALVLPYFLYQLLHCHVSLH